MALAPFPSTPFYEAGLFGVVPNGQDMTANLTVLMALVAAAGGGTIQFDAGVYRINGQIILPFESVTVNRIAPTVRWVGVGAFTDGRPDPGAGGSVAPSGGTQIDLRYDHATEPKLWGKGAGLFFAEGINFVHPAPSNNPTGPMMRFDWTSPRIQDCGFYTPQFLDTGWDVDAIQFGSGSTGQTGFNGYGGAIQNCWFNGIRRAIFVLTWGNGPRFENNTIWAHCGGVTPMEVRSVVSAPNGGGVFFGNIIECGAYQYGGVFEYCNGLYINNLLYDTNNLTAGYRAEANCRGCWFTGYFNGVVPFKSQATAGSNNWVVFDVNQGEASELSVPLHLYPVDPLATITQGTGAGAASYGLRHLDPGTGKSLVAKGSPNDANWVLNYNPDGVAIHDVPLFSVAYVPATPLIQPIFTVYGLVVTTDNGDPAIQYRSNTTNFREGIDVDDTNWKLCVGTVLGTNTIFSVSPGTQFAGLGVEAPEVKLDVAGRIQSRNVGSDPALLALKNTNIGVSNNTVFLFVNSAALTTYIIPSGATGYTLSNAGAWVFGVAQSTPSGVTSGFVAGSGTSMNNDSTSTGGIGSTPATFGDVVRVLKLMNILAA